MNVVIDANRIAGYFKESVLELNTDLTDKATYIIDRPENQDQVYLDINGNIEKEWESVVDSEWFSVWFARLLIDEKAYCIEVDLYSFLCKKLRLLGFPRSRDIWYIRTAKEISNNQSRAYIISEDIDFFDPSKKCSSSSSRLTILKNRRGPICKYLDKNENILVNSIYSYLKTA